MNSRTFSITLPSLHWKRVCSWKGLCFLGLLAIGGLGTYWWKEIRPFVSIADGIVQVTLREMVSEEDGKLSEVLTSDSFQQAQVLFSTRDPRLVMERKQIQEKIEHMQKEVTCLQEKLDQNMQQYMYLQTELEAQIGPTELTDQIFVEIQKLQNQIQHLEQESQPLRARQESLETKLAEQVSLAPFDGIILRRFKEEGSRVEKGEPVLAICDRDHRWIEAKIEEKMLAHVHPGLPARIGFSSSPGKKWDGEVSWVSPLVESGAVKIRLKADSLPLHPGLSAQVHLKIH
jgi:multidrug resistance efflux pump